MKDRLKKIRTILGFNQHEFAKKLLIEVNTYKGYEYKTKNLPDLLLINLVKEFNVNLNWLLTGDGEMFISTVTNSLTQQDNTFTVKYIKTFYKRLNKIQSENNLNDYQFAKLLNISESRLEKLGIGKVFPTLDELNSIKSAFDVSIDWLLYGESTGENSEFSPDEVQALKKLAKKLIP